MSPRSFPKVIAAVGGVTFLLFGVWALAAPSGFFDAVAAFDPYNAHFIRDIGAFQVGLGAALILAAFLTDDALAAVLLGVGAGAVLHVVSHLASVGDGGTPAFDIPALSILGVLLLAGGIMRWSRAAER